MFNLVYKTKNIIHTKNFILFLRANKAKKFNIGFVASKKVGNAVARNRAKRLIKASTLANANKFGSNYYVFVAKVGINNADFKTINKDVSFALNKLSSK